MKVVELLNEINRQLPPLSAMEDDRIGLQIQTETDDIVGVLFTIEINDAVVNECVKLGYNTIITFHPLIYNRLSTISLSERVGRLCSKLIKHNINVISVHTTFDSHINGTNRILADMLGLETISFLVPNPNVDNCGMGVIAKPNESITLERLVENIHNVCGGNIKYCGSPDTPINRIGIVGGSGSYFIPQVIERKCDAFITADCSYHQFHAANEIFALIDVGHYEMEQYVAMGMRQLFADFLDSDSVKYKLSNINTNPVNYCR